MCQGSSVTFRLLVRSTHSFYTMSLVVCSPASRQSVYSLFSATLLSLP